MVRLKNRPAAIAAALIVVLSLPSAALAQSITEIQRLIAGDTPVSSRFGPMVVLDGDTAAVLGNEKGSYRSCGPIYIYVRKGSSWIEQATLDANDGQTGDCYSSIAVDDDTLAVSGQSGASSNSTVFVFARHNGMWAEQSRIQTFRYLTNAIGVSGDTILLGTSWQDTNSVRIYERVNSVWTEQAEPLGLGSYNYGESLAFKGDLAIVGDPDYRSEGGGLAYIYRRTNGVWNREVFLDAGTDRWSDDDYGSSVDISGDRAIVGSPGVSAGDCSWGGNNCEIYTGAAYVYSHANGAWTLQQKLISPNESPDQYFGTRVALSGEMAMVGDEATTVGREGFDVYTYLLEEQSWSFFETLQLSYDQTGAALGSWFALDDGIAIVGTAGEEALASSTAGTGIVGAFLFCGAPNYDRSRVRGTFLWQDCSSAEKFFVRVTGGGTTPPVWFEGLVEASSGITEVNLFNTESNDEVLMPDTTQLSYSLLVNNSGQDGFDFTVQAPSGGCITFEQPDGSPVYVGMSRTLAPDSSIDLLKGGPCHEQNETPVTSWFGHGGGVTTTGNEINFSGSPNNWSNTVNSAPLSEIGFSDDFETRWTVNSDPDGATWVVGLGIGESRSNWRDVDLALRNSQGRLKVYENGTWVTSGPVLAVGDIVSIHTKSGAAEYRINGSPLVTSAYAGNPEFYVDSSFKTGSASLSVTVAGSGSAPVPGLIPVTSWSGQAGGVTASGDALSYSGTPTGWSNTINSAQHSTLGATDNYSVSWTIGSNPINTTWTVGLGIDETGSSWRDIDFAFRSSDGSLRIYENGGLRDYLPALSVGDVLSMHVDGNSIHYIVNGFTIYTSAILGTEDFYIDTAFKSGAIELESFSIEIY